MNHENAIIQLELNATGNFNKQSQYLLWSFACIFISFFFSAVFLNR